MLTASDVICSTGQTGERTEGRTEGQMDGHQTEYALPLPLAAASVTVLVIHSNKILCDAWNKSLIVHWLQTYVNCGKL